MRELTAEQAGAVGRRQGSLLLAANAGSGKTSVLVERFVAAVLEDGIEPGRILAITFTERAAGELRERIRARFGELGRREQARDTEAAFVGTIHGFCARLLRAHAPAAGLDPAFEVLDEPSAERLRTLAFQRALAALLAGAEALDIVAAYGVDRLARAITAVHEELRSRGHERPVLPQLASPEPPSSASLARAARALGAELAGAGDGARVTQAVDAIAAAAELELDPARPPLPSQLRELVLPGGKASALRGPACVAYGAALTELSAACADWHATVVARAMGRLLERYGGAYAELKRERSALDFDDLELGARRLLDRHPGVRASWAERFELLMLDEFQDTNRRQLALVEALERDNLFTVGDEFQSIYGFRHADVSIFRERRERLAARGASTSLARNFRSCGALLEVINAVFEPCFGTGFVALQRGREPDPEGHGARVELLVTDTRGWEEVDLGDTLPPAPRWRQAEARLLAQRVDDLVTAGEAAAGDIAVLVRATGDIPVYERALEDRGLPTLAAGGGGYWSHQQVTDLLTYLAALANPLDQRALYGALASPLVGVSSDGLAALAIALGERTRLWPALAAAFTGDRGGEWRPPSADPLQQAPTELADVLGEADPLQRAPAELADVLGEADRARLERFCPRFAAQRRIAPRLSLDALLERAVAGSGYDLHVLAQRWGERRLANVHKLGRLARSYEASEGRDLRGFVEHATRQAQAEIREAEAPVEDAELDAVRLMSIHAAKGLEYPVVCIADLGRQGRLDTPDLLVVGERVGLRLVALDGAPGVAALDYEALRDERLEAGEHEERRILYVGMTRARERLILSGAANLGSWPRPRPGAPPLSWLGPALVPGLVELAAAGGEQGLAGAGVGVAWALSSPASVGGVLRAESLAAPAPPAPPAPVVAAPVALADAPVEPVPAAGLRALSYSALADLGRCGYRFYLERVLGMPAVEEPARDAPLERATRAAGQQLDPRLRGTLAHALLERIDFELPAVDPQELATLAGELGVRAAGPALGEVRGLVEAIAGSELALRLAAAPRVRREYAFAFSLGPRTPMINGVVDVIAYELGGRCLIVDYKTDRVADADLEALVERDYAIQRTTYALAALRGGALEVEVVHWFLERAREPVLTRLEQADVARLEGELRALAKAVAESSFEVSGEPHRELCQGCPGRRALCSWGEQMTLRERSEADPRMIRG